MSESTYHEPVQDRAIATRERLLDALEKLLRTTSINELTVSAIAAEAGVTTGAIYRRFADKRGLLQAASERAHRAATTAQTLDEVHPSCDEDLISHMLSGILNYALSHMPLMRATAALNDEVSFAHMQAARNDVASALARNLQHSVYRGEELERRARFALRTATGAIRDTYMSGPGAYDASISPPEFRRRKRKSVAGLLDNLQEMLCSYLGVEKL